MGKTKYLITIASHRWVRASKVPKTATSAYIDHYEFYIWRESNGKIKKPAVFLGLLRITPTNYATIYEKKNGQLKKVWAGKFSSKYRDVSDLIRKVVVPKIRRR